MPTSPKSPVSIFTALTRERGTAKEAALRAVGAMITEADRSTLRALLLQALAHDYAAPRADQHEDLKIQDARCWILSALGRIADRDDVAIREVRRHLDPSIEPYEWARYWALEGLVAAKAPDLDEVAQHITAAGKDESLVLYLANAVRASRGDTQCRTLLQDALQKPSQTWAALRALRVVPVVDSTIVHRLCEIVAEGSYSDHTFDAIFALGSLPPDSAQAEPAAQVLADYLVRYRWPSYDGMRTRALVALGQLKVQRVAPVLSEELLDDSPAIVSAAARALESLLGVTTATLRIVEIAATADPDTQVKLAGALRYMTRLAVVEELERAMLGGPEPQQSAARNLLSEVGGADAFQRLRARSRAVTDYTSMMRDAEARIQGLFEDSLVEARQGFRVATVMDITVFALGILLIASSASVVVWRGGTLDSWAGVGVTGGAGVLGVIYGLLIANPRRFVRESVDHLMHLKIVFLAYLRQLHQTDNAYTRRLLDDKEFSATEVTSYTRLVSDAMAAALLNLQATTKSTKTADTKPTADKSVTKPTAELPAAHALDAPLTPAQGAAPT
jgi:HEAT repeat protein